MSTIMRTNCVRKGAVCILLSQYTQTAERFKTLCSSVSQYIRQSFTKEGSKPKATSPDIVTFLYYFYICVVICIVFVNFYSCRGLFEKQLGMNEKLPPKSRPSGLGPVHPIYVFINTLFFPNVMSFLNCCNYSFCTFSEEV